MAVVEEIERRGGTGRAPRDKAIVLWTLRYADEVRPAESAPARADAKMTRLVTKLIQARTADWTPDLVSDPVQENLEKIIAGKKSKAKKPARRAKATPEPTGDKVVSIMDALKRSLAVWKR